MFDQITASPLCWPSGWKRTSSRYRVRARFSNKNYMQGGYEPLTIKQGIQRVTGSLRAMGIPDHNVIVSTDLKLRGDGLPYSTQPTGQLDVGAAVYWLDGKNPRCMAIDQYIRIQDNLAAIAATIDAMRAIERHGGALILDRAFQGFVALPAPEAWWQTLGLSGPYPSKEVIDASYRKLASKHHPDNGGDTDMMARINRARDLGYAALT